MNHQTEPTDPNPSDNPEVGQLFNLVGSIAGGLKNSILTVFIGGISAASFLAWQWIDFSTSYYWIILKTLPLLIPLILWGFLYMVIAELAELPNLAKIAKQDGNDAIQSIKNKKQHTEKTSGFFGKIKSLFRILRGAGNLAAIVGAVQGVVLIANPFSALLFFISGLVLILFVFIALLVLIF